ncbi:MAG: response regulator [Flavobacteriales bacterium]|jgi:CheY-like chemotaxis protein
MRKLIVHLIDDNDIDIAVNSKLLNLAKIGDEVLVYSSGAQFVDAIHSNHIELNKSDNIILLDIMMPGLNGFQTMEKFNALPAEETTSFNVFMLSSSIDRNDIKNAEATPRVLQVLEKPLDVYQLRRLIEGLQ